MSWPLSQDYNEAIQNPRSSFSDAELRDGQVTVNALGLPLPRSGNFADVYEFHCPKQNTRWAIKCFTRKVAGLRERYSKISRHLKDARLPFTVAFQYLEQGIRIRGEWYPILKMRWVQGYLLNEFVRDNLDKPALVQSLGLIWQRMARRLREADIAHADLQHGNVLLVPGATSQSLGVRLIDYDGMFVPALAGGKSGEVGHPNYQHPQRLREGTYNAEVDRVPLLVVATALRALSVGGRELWERHDNGDNLLFKESDLRAPADSELFRELKEMPDPLVKKLAARLAEACELRLEDAPLLEGLLPEDKPAAKSASRPAGAITATVPPSAEVEEAPDWDFGQYEEDEPARARPKRKKRGKQEKGKVPGWVWAAGGAAALLLLLVGVVIATRGGRDKPNGPVVAGTRTDKPPAKERQGPPPKDSIKPPDHREKPPETGGLTPGGVAAEQILPGHQGINGGAVFSHDGKRAVISDAGKLHVWDMVTLQRLSAWPGFGGVFWRLALTRDADKLLCVNGERPQLVDLDTGKILHECEPVTQFVIKAVAVSPDGKRGALGGWVVGVGTLKGSEVRLWDLETGKRAGTFKGHTNDILSVAFSPEGDKLLSLGQDGLRLWEASSGRELDFWSLPSQGGRLAPGALQAVTASNDGHFVVWDIKGRKEVGRFTSPGSVAAIDFAGDGRVALCQQLASPGPSVVRLFDARSGKEVRTLKGHTAQVYRVTGSPDGRRLLSFGADKTLRLWDLTKLPAPTPEPPEPAVRDDPAVVADGQILPGNQAAVPGALFSEDGKWVVAADDAGNLHVWDRVKRRHVSSWPGFGGVSYRLALTPNGDRLLCVNGGNALQLVDLKTGKNVRNFEKNTGNVFTVAVSPDGKHGATADWSKNSDVCVWDLETGKRVGAWKGHTEGVVSVAFSPDGGKLISLGRDGLRVWEASSGKELDFWRLPLSGGRLSPAGRQAVTTGDHAHFVVWDVQTRKELGRFTSPGGVYSYDFAGDGRVALCYAGTNAEQCVLRVFDARSGKEVRTLKGHTNQVRGVAGSPDGRRLLSFSDDRTLQLWDLTGAPVPAPSPEPPPRSENREVARRLDGDGQNAASVAFSPDEQLLVTGHDNPQPAVRLWDVTTGKQLHVFTDVVGPVRSITFSADGKKIVGSLGVGTRSWDVASKKAVGRQMAGAFLSPGLRYRASLSKARNGYHLRFWSREAPADYCFFPVESHVNVSLSFSADSSRVAFHCNQGRLRVFDLSARRLVLAQGMPPRASGAFISPNGQHVLVSYSDHDLRLWDVKGRKAIRTFSGHKAGVRTAIFSADGKRAYSADFDGVVLVWDVATGKTLGSLKGASKGIGQMVLSPDGRRLAAVGGDGVYLWDLGGKVAGNGEGGGP